MIRVGFLGDVVGKPGREMLKRYVKEMKTKFSLDFVVANCENASGGFGLSAKNAVEIFEYGVDVITGGNHSFDKKDVLPLMQTLPILRPFNHYDNTDGKGVITLKNSDGKSLSVINMLGAMGLNLVKNPFLSIDEALNLCESKNILVDYHAEMTSEKMAFFWDNKERVSAVFGTHTHVGTDDLKISGNAVYVSDAGLVGAREGVIGMDAAASVAGFKTGIKHSFGVNEKYKKIFQMIVFECENGVSTDAFKIKIIDENEIITKAYND
ncbi:TIGR00282 family metallophosphoesterase [Campylobacter geochelonis]|uniref:Metallophosphoesterase n=1 Tax=Campylobacter geochelonis TaxID=1780362 RepID=A0A128EEX4_9BACT|nr:TIGR00282 family metallophosphoesterase [Campylobacter geochelonis]QKF70989.1 metallophosphoesterase (YmdB domain) [Campylobacter geochelonis]CZE47107.1 metallophosphoesterase [Campylobacter geochelonis]CZE50195.1 metallophosphoesterase [Campylobacter geochelonis]